MVVAIAFMSSGIAHLLNPYEFLSHVYNYNILKLSTGQYVVMVLPVCECFVGTYLLSGVAISASFLLAACLCLVFIAAQISVLWRGMVIACGCSGLSGSDIISLATIGKSAALFIASIIGVMSRRLYNTREPD
jgi:hypothetical protein